MSDEEIPKPRELLAARTAAEQLFMLLRRWFDVPESVRIDLRGVDSAVEELSDPVLVMAMAMRKLQALHLLTTPGVLTTTDVVLTVIQDLERALLQAPPMHLRDAAASTDWDAEFAALDDGEQLPGAAADREPGGPYSGNTDASGGDPGGGHPGGPGPRALPDDAPGERPDDEIAVFKAHHRALHEAARAVLRASDGQIRRLI